MDGATGMGSEGLSLTTSAVETVEKRLDPELARIIKKEERGDRLSQKEMERFVAHKRSQKRPEPASVTLAADNKAGKGGLVQNLLERIRRILPG